MVPPIGGFVDPPKVESGVEVGPTGFLVVLEEESGFWELELEG